MKTGKLPGNFLSNLLGNIKSDETVLIGPKLGMDGAIIKPENDLLVVVSDPITFETDNIGYYSLAVNANDIAVMGGEPKYFLATILLPPNTNEMEIQEIFNNLLSACNNLNIFLIGGHTEITSSVTRPVINGTMLGKSLALPKPKEVLEGDILLQINPVAIEGTAILATSGKEVLKKATISDSVIQKGYSYFENLGICIANPAKIALKSSENGILLMHDPTEGGICAAISEMAYAIEKQICVYKEKIMILEECKFFCEALGLNPLGLIASGSLLIIAKKDESYKIKKSLNESKYEVSEIGFITNISTTSSEQAFWKDTEEDYPVFERDEIARFFDE